MGVDGFQILILEDDSILGESLLRYLQGLGHQAELHSSLDEARDSFFKINFDFALVDCFLPGQTGPDFLEELIQEKKNSKIKVLFMSGILTDKSYVGQVLQKPFAKGFLKKPFELEILKEYFQKNSEDSGGLSKESPFKILFSNPQFTLRKKMKLLESFEEVIGFDLPLLWSVLLQSKASGDLFIYHANNEISSLTFCNGEIVAVDVRDSTTFLGQLLIQSGFALPKDVEHALEQKGKIRIGTYLIENNMLSPHAFNRVLLDQMNLRMAQLISQDPIRILFAPGEKENMAPCLGGEDFILFLYDWIASKLPLSWLQNTYLEFFQIPLVWNSTLNPLPESVLNLPLFKSEVLDQDIFKNPICLSDFLRGQKEKEEAHLKRIHFLILLGSLRFSFESISVEFQQLSRLKQLHFELQGKSSREIYDILEKYGVDAHHSRAFFDRFLQMLGEKPKESQSEEGLLWRDLYKTLMGLKDIAQYGQRGDQLKGSLNHREFEKKEKAELLLEEVKNQLQKIERVNSVPKMEEILALFPGLKFGKIYLAWAKILNENFPSQNTSLMKEIELLLNQVPPEERYINIYSFVYALYYKLCGDYKSSLRELRKSLALDAQYLPARRELQALEFLLKEITVETSQKAGERGVKGVMASLFKKR